MSFSLIPASASACLTGPMVRSTKWLVSWSNLARLSVMFKCFGPEASAVMNGKLMSVCEVEDNSHLPFSAAS